MTTIKSYTDLEQSRKLAKILPLESADMVYIKHSTSSNPDWRFDGYIPPMVLGKTSIKDITVGVLPCWSLAVLLSVLPDYTLQTNTDGTVFVVCDSKKPIPMISYDNPVDACYEMIICLHELNLL